MCQARTKASAGFVRDVQSFDPTMGGYEPPYTGYTGEPIDWATLDVTNTGIAHRGHVVNVLVDCTSGTTTSPAAVTAISLT